MTQDTTETYKPKKPKNPTYRSRAEVEQLEELVPGKGFHKDDYKSVIADYVGTGLEFECCLIKTSGNKCGQSHDWGYVVELQDGTFTVVGNHCVFSELKPGDHIHQDIRSFRRRRDHLDRIQGIRNEAQHIGDRLEYMELYLDQLGEIQQFLNRFRETFGGTVYKNLSERAKSGRNHIAAIGTKRVKYKDDYGNEKYEKQKRNHTVDTLQGLEIFDGSASELRDRIDSTIKFYREFSESSISEEWSDEYINQINDRFSEYGRYGREVDALSRALTRFKSNNLWNLSCLFDATDDRERALQGYYSWTGEKRSRAQIEDEIKEFDDQLTKYLDVDQVQYRQ